MTSRSLLALLASAGLLAFGCGGEQKPSVQQTQVVGTVPDTLPPARIVPGAAGSSPVQAAPESAQTVTPATPQAVAPAPAQAVTPAPAPARQSQAAPAAPVIVDVRTQQEYDAGHIKGAILIPYDQMEQRWQELKQYQQQPVLLYCRSGRRSGIALDVLRSKGFTQLENGGGIDAMATRGFQVVKE